MMKRIEMTENSSRDKWERTRMLAAICIQPHVRKRITPRQLLPLPWDNKNSVRKKNPQITPEERKKRFETLLKSV